MLLQIRHTGKSENGRPLFLIVNGRKQTETPVPIASPWEITIGTQSLRQGLQWYLEKYLELPIDNFRARAEQIQAALSQWGQDCLRDLFADEHARGWYRDEQKENFTNLQLEIVSDDAEVLSWPWEVLESRDDGLLVLKCHIERRLEKIGDARSKPKKLPQEQLNILYIIARPYGDHDVGFQTLARPLIDFVNKGGWPVHIDLLRPPTFDRLRAVLKENPDFYHIVHFDGHGGFDDNCSASGGYIDPNTKQAKYTGQSGKLVFEKDDTKHSPDEIPAAMLGELLRKHNIPVMVLNACQSAMHTTDPFTSVAVSLLRAGIRGVVAMSYSLWVRGAEVFVPEFYRNLFQAGDLADAMQAGRREMYRNQMRNTSFGQEEFQDWMVPVLYQQEAEGILPKLDPGERRESVLPSEMQELGDYGFIGRDSAIQKLERAIRNKPAGILIHGMAGEGKTILAKGFLNWLEATHGLGKGAFWFSFEDIHSGESIIDSIAGTLFGIEALTLPVEQKLAIVTRALRENRFFIIWDNFESASGIPGTEVAALIEKEADRNLLKRLLRNLRGGQSKVIITSRSEEKWLTLQECFRLPLEGLKGEELWQYCNEIVTDLGLSLDRESQTYKKLMEKLEGNPLAVRAILLRLQEKPAAALLAELEEEFRGYEGDEGTQRIQIALQVFERGLDKNFAPTFRLIGLHEHFLDADYLELMLQSIKENTAPLKDCLTTLENAGLCRHIGNNIYKIHPALRSCLTRLHPAREPDRRAFVDVMGSLADSYSPKELHEQRYIFTLFSANFYRALHLAREMAMRTDVLALMQALAVYAKHIRNYSEAEQLYTQYAENGDEEDSATYHQLGDIAQERRDFETAENWFKKSLEISHKQGKEHDAALTYHKLGIIAQKRRNFETAEDLYKKSLKIKLKQGDEDGAASTYHQLGMITEEWRDFETAEGWYQKSLEIKLKKGNEHGAALTYHQLGRIAEERRDFETSEDWYKKSLEITLKQGDEHGAAGTYHQLGMIALKRWDFETAEDWYKKSLEIKLKQGDEHGVASTYHELGIIAQERQDFETAEDWYKKALDISLKQGNEHGAALTYHQLGRIAEERRDFETAEGWYKKSLIIFKQYQDKYNATIAKSSLTSLNKTKKGGNP